MRFGFHISISGGFSKVVEKAEIRGCENIQFFSRNPNGLIVKWLQSVTQTNHLPFDFPFALRLSKGERFAQDRLVEA
jgi:endonuclease IV